MRGVTLHYRGKYIQEAIIRDLSQNKYVRGEGREGGREGGVLSRKQTISFLFFATLVLYFSMFHFIMHTGAWITRKN